MTGLVGRRRELSYGQYSSSGRVILDVQVLRDLLVVDDDLALIQGHSYSSTVGNLSRRTKWPAQVDEEVVTT